MVHFLPPCSITATAHILCVIIKSWCLELCSLLRREWWHVPEAGAVHLQHCLWDLSPWSGVHGSLPSQQVSDASQRHIKRLYSRLWRKKRFTIMALSPIKNSKYESARGHFSIVSNATCTECIRPESHVRFITKVLLIRSCSHYTHCSWKALDGLEWVRDCVRLDNGE